MSTFTKERLEQLANFRGAPVTRQEEQELARIALASLEAEPAIHRWRRVTSEPYGPYPWHYGDFIGFSKPVDGIEDEYFYSAPPAPANAEPAAWLWSHRKHPSEVTLVRPEDDEKAEGAHWSGWSCQALYAAPPAPVSVPDEIYAELYQLREEVKGPDGFNTWRDAATAEKVLRLSMERDAFRYRFLRDKDAFGDENEPGLASWDDLAEMEYNEFDAAVDARMNDSDMPRYSITQGQMVENDVAASEKKAPNERYKQISDIDYLGAMSAFHSDEWHKMGPITGYMHGWNSCRAAMLQGAENAESTTTMQTTPARDSSPKIAESTSGNSPVIPDGWVMVPVDMPHEMMRAVQVNSELGAYAATNLNGAYSLFREFWDVAVTAAPKQEAK